MPMVRKPDMPSEFAHFLRDIGIRAFDQVASLLELETGPDEGRVRKLAGQWNKLSPAERERFFDYVVRAAEQAVAAAPALPVGRPAAARARRGSSPKPSPPRPLQEGAPRRYYDPADAEATLPDKVKKKKKKSDTIIDIETVSTSDTKSESKKRAKKV